MAPNISLDMPSIQATIAIEAMQMIITVLGSQKDGWGMAFWFGSSDGCLGGRQPKSVLTEDPRAVLEAAELEVCGAMHG